MHLMAGDHGNVDHAPGTAAFPDWLKRNEQKTNRLNFCCTGCKATEECNDNECCLLRELFQEAIDKYEFFNLGSLVFGVLVSIVVASLVAGGMFVAALVVGIIALILSTLAFVGRNDAISEGIGNAVSDMCWLCMQRCFKRLGINSLDELLAFVIPQILGLLMPLKAPVGSSLPYITDVWPGIVFLEGTGIDFFGYSRDFNPWRDYTKQMFGVLYGF